ncbi:MAG: hypothetical protein JW778_00965 [Candidatus Altiarchaeota archaeon]|nr:hypothetical protein [Candidatus Altiarchaeota archaeon]
MGADDSEINVEEVGRVLIEPLVGRDKTGAFIERNFASVRTLAAVDEGKVKPVRPRLGDYSHLAFLNVITNSFLPISPLFVRNLYRLGKVVGYFCAHQVLPFYLSDLVLPLAKKTNLSLMTLKDKSIQDLLAEGWLEAGGGILSFDRVDNKEGKIVVSIKETASSPIHNVSNPQCYFEAGVISGHLEYLVGGTWDGIETKCIAKGDDRCVIELFRDGGSVIHQMPAVSHKEAEAVLDQYLDIALSGRKYMGRDHVNDYGHMYMTQAINYVLLSQSPPHRVLVKHAGKVVGGKIAQRMNFGSAANALNHLSRLFEDLKVGFLDVNYKPEKINVSVDESLFSYGVEDIGMKLCIYLAGILEGCLNNATGKKWAVEEETCIADGDETCSLSCVTQRV